MPLAGAAGGSRLGGRLEHHGELSAFDTLASTGHIREIIDFLDHLIEDALPEFGTTKFPAAKANRDLDVLPLAQKSPGVFDLEVEIVVFGLRPELYFLDLDGMLTLFGFLRPLLLFVEVFAPIHDSHHGRSGSGGYFDQIEATFIRPLSRLVECYDTDLLTVGIYEADRTDANLFVYSVAISTDDALRLRVGVSYEWS